MSEEKYPDSPRSINLDEICLKENFGDLKFEHILPLLKKMKGIIVELEDLNYREYLTVLEIRQIDSARGDFNSFVKKIQEFTLNQNNPKDIRDNIQNQVTSFYHNDFAQKTRSSLTFLRQEAKLDNKTEKELQDSVARAKKLETELSEKLASIKIEEKSVEKGSGIIASKFLSKEFENQFDTHENAAAKWFRLLISFYILLGTAISFNFMIYLIHIRPTKDHFLMIEWGVFTFLCVSILFYGLSFAVRNFNIHKNLASINRHRRNVAQTLTSFLESDKSIDVRNAFLKDAAPALFEHQSTGYLDKDQIQVSTPVQEMVTKIITDKTTG